MSRLKQLSCASSNFCRKLIQNESRRHLCTSSCSFTMDSCTYCDGYDDALYDKMKNDINRTSFYRNVINKYCKDKVVLDIGCGALALLAIMASEANASKIYAIEINELAYLNAKQLIHDKGLQNKIEILNGHSNDLQLPEKCDLIVHEIIGEIGSCEGVYAVIEDAKKKFLKSTDSEIWSIPDYVQTYLTPVEFPDIEYWQSLEQKIIANEQCKTINLWNFPERHYLSNDWMLWEHIQFNDNTKLCNQFQNEHVFVAQKNGVLGGLLASIEIGVDKENILSNKGINNNCMWANKLMILDSKIEIERGDLIHVNAKTDASNVELKYDFKVSLIK